MKKRISNLAVLLLVGLILTFAPALFTGCASSGDLAADGVYQQNATLYNADKSIGVAYDTMHTFVSWEYQNRQALSQYPQIKQAADHVRINAKEWLQSATALRLAYATDPSAQNKSQLENALNVLQEALNQAAKYMNTAITNQPPANP